MALTRLGLNQSINLASNVTGTLPTANGGTAMTSGIINGNLVLIKKLFHNLRSAAALYHQPKLSPEISQRLARAQCNRQHRPQIDVLLETDFLLPFFPE